MPKPYFVILHQSEIERCETASQIVVFAAIKSYSANGKNEVALSLREISNRCLLSHVFVGEVVTQLTLLKLISIIGEEKRLGGSINIYKVLTELTVNQNKVLTTGGESVNYSKESVNSVGTKLDKVIKKEEKGKTTPLPSTPTGNKNLSPLTFDEKRLIALETGAKFSFVESKAMTALEHYSNADKSLFGTLAGKVKKFVLEDAKDEDMMDEFERQHLEDETPEARAERVKAGEKVKKIFDLMHKKGGNPNNGF